MRRKIPAILLVSVLLFGSCKKKALLPDIRATVWGASPDEVILSETTEYIYYDDDMLLYTDDFSGETADITYVFEKEKLISARADFLIGDRILKEVIDSYDRMAASLIGIYGDPLQNDKRVWADASQSGRLPDYLNPPGSEQPEDDDVYIYYHELRYVLTWTSERTDARLILEMTNQTEIMYYFMANRLVAAETG